MDIIKFAIGFIIGILIVWRIEHLRWQRYRKYWNKRIESLFNEYEKTQLNKKQ